MLSRPFGEPGSGHNASNRAVWDGAASLKIKRIQAGGVFIQPGEPV
jgi:hypothetical protein